MFGISPQNQRQARVLCAEVAGQLLNGIFHLRVGRRLLALLDRVIDANRDDCEGKGANDSTLDQLLAADFRLLFRRTFIDDLLGRFAANRADVGRRPCAFLVHAGFALCHRRPAVGAGPPVDLFFLLARRHAILLTAFRAEDVLALLGPLDEPDVIAARARNLDRRIVRLGFLRRFVGKQCGGQSIDIHLLGGEHRCIGLGNRYDPSAIRVLARRGFAGVLVLEAIVRFAMGTIENNGHDLILWPR